MSGYGLQTLRGIIHCHSDLSYDGQHSVEELCQELAKKGFDFVALTEHGRGIGAAAYADFVARCQRLSSEDFVVIPGLEILCPDGTEIAGIGLEQIVAEGAPAQVVDAVKEAGAFSIWVHPRKRGPLPPHPYPSHAIELLNGKEDGTIAPALSLLTTLRRWQKKERFFIIMGLDLHVLDQPLNVWTECEVADRSAAAIIAALQGGNFCSQASGIRVPARGALRTGLLMRVIARRLAYLFWNGVLDILPGRARQAMINMSRPLIRKIKRP